MRFPVAIGLCLFPLASAPLAQSVLDVNGLPDPAYPGFHAWFDAQDGVNGAGQPASGAALTSFFNLYRLHRLTDGPTDGKSVHRLRFP